LDPPPLDPGAVQAVFSRARDYFLTQEGQPRSRSPYPRRKFATSIDWRVHTDLVVRHADAIFRASAAYRRDLNVLVSRGIWRMFRIAETEYRRTLDAHAVLDFSDLLLRTLDLLRRMEEFAQSRYRLESRYHHVLVDEFQDTSRAQWELVSLLIQSWGEGAGLAGGPLQPSIFIVGDRKQSIYGFRDADVSVLREAARHIEVLRPDRDVRRSISRSFRAVPPLLAFVNDVCQDLDKAAGDQAFQYEEADRFPIEDAGSAPRNPAYVRDGALGLIVADTSEDCAEITAAEIARLLSSGTSVRDRDTGVARPVRAGDIAILFRSRESHRDFEAALARRGIRCYVYKGLGFFDADEIKDVLALVWYLADPESDLRAAALMRSRFFGISDEALRVLAPRLADALSGGEPPAALESLRPPDVQAIIDARASTLKWRRLVDRIPPAELVDVILRESAYAFELGGPRFQQARENLKKIRSLLRRLQNRGYATLPRIATHLDRLAVGDEANAVVDALDAVNLMTVHASKGLEFPVVFIVNLARGTANRRDPVRLSLESAGGVASVAVGDFQSDADEERAARDREETKRLLYVALTRARDRVYLATALKDGQVAPGRGSLAEVLPSSLLAHFTGCRSAEASAAVEWRASSGTAHRLQVCSPEDGEAPHEPERFAPEESDFTPLLDPGTSRRTPSSTVELASDDSDRLVGRMVHRLLQRFGFEAEGALSHETALRMLRPEEMAGLSVSRTATELADDAAAAYRAIRDRQDVRALYLSGERLHEVPFTMRVEGAVVRGRIDCLVRSASDRMTVLEFKTGRPRDEHRVQLDLYRRAAERLFPGILVDARLVYG
jgi:ATP-dependent helicase/nuclease subunit A